MIPCFHCTGEDSIPGQGTEIPMPSSTAKKKKNCNTNLHGTEPGHKCKSSIGEMPITWFLAGPLSSFCTHSWAYIHSFLHTHTLLAHWDRALYTSSLYVVHHLLSAFSALFCESVLCAVLSSSVAWLFASPWLYPARLLCPWEFSRQEYCSGLPCPPLEDLCNPGIEPRSPTLQADSLRSEPLVNL